MSNATKMLACSLWLAACGEPTAPTGNVVAPPGPPPGAVYGSFRPEQVPAPHPGASLPFAPPAPRDPSRWRPRPDNPGGVNGTRPERPAPGAR